MESGSVPVTLVRLGVDAGLNLVVLGDSVKNVSGDVEVVSHLDGVTDTNLELPLRSHDFGVESADLDSSSEAVVKVLLDDGSSEGNGSTSRAVVRTLSTFTRLSLVEPLVGEVNEILLLLSIGINIGVWSLLSLEEDVLLLHTILRTVLSNLIEDGNSLGSVVSSVGGHVRVEALSQDQLMVLTSERIVEDSNRSDDDIGAAS